jgi:hypothetical protein
MQPSGADWQDLYRPASRGWPAAPDEWELRPYFILDYDMSWRDLRGYLTSERLSERAWAVARVLDGARWPDIWLLLTPADIGRVLDRLPRALRETWTDALQAWS